MKIDDKTSHNSPSLRFPEFTGEWEKYKIEDITDAVSSGKSKNHFSNGEYNLYGSTGIIGRTDKALYDGKLVLVARVGANAGFLQIINEPCGITDNTLILKPKGIDAFYLYYFLQHFNLNRLIFGSGQPLITGGKLKKVKVSLGTISEQSKIVKFLSLLDERIAVQSRLIEDLKKLRCALEERMLGQCQGKQVRLRDILIERVEKSRINNQYEVLSSTVSGIYSQREYFNKEIASADNTGYKAIHRGDVVLSPQNLWMGNINYNDRFEIGIVSPSYKVFSIDEKFDKGYIAFLLKTRKALWAYSLVSEQGASIVRRNLNYESFLEISFVIPSLKEQQATARRLSAFKQKQTMEEAFLRSLLLQKEFMLKSLFI